MSQGSPGKSPRPPSPHTPLSPPSSPPSRPPRRASPRLSQHSPPSSPPSSPPGLGISGGHSGSFGGVGGKEGMIKRNTSNTFSGDRLSLPGGAFREEKSTKKAVEERVKNLFDSDGETLSEPLSSSGRPSLDLNTTETLASSRVTHVKRTKIVYRDEEGLTFMPEDLQEGKDFPRIKLASLEKLLEFLTHEKYSDSLLRTSFFLTYRSFTTPLEVLHALMHRFGGIPPEICPPCSLFLPFPTASPPTSARTSSKDSSRDSSKDSSKDSSLACSSSLGLTSSPSPPPSPLSGSRPPLSDNLRPHSPLLVPPSPARSSPRASPTPPSPPPSPNPPLSDSTPNLSEKSEKSERQDLDSEGFTDDLTSLTEGGVEDEEEGELVVKARRVRVIGVLKAWMEDYFADFGEDEEFLELLSQFIEQIGLHIKGSEVHLKRTYTKGKEKAISLGQLKDTSSSSSPSSTSETSSPKKVVLAPFVLPCPSPPYPSNPPGGRKGHGEWEWLWKEVGADVVAEQLTLLESELYCKITPRECIAHLKSKNKEVDCPILHMLVHHFNQISRSVSATIAQEIRLQERAKILEKFMDILSNLYKLQNMNGIMEILSGINASASRRMKKTFALLPQEKIEVYEKMNALVSPDRSFKKYRTFLHEISPPCVPYVGIYLTDLTFLEDGNPDDIDGKINFSKRVRLAQVILEIRQYQELFKMAPYPAVRNALISLTPLSEAESYEASLISEPKNVEQLLAKMITAEEKMREEIRELEAKLGALK